jgi:hypothetical protein
MAPSEDFIARGQKCKNLPRHCFVAKGVCPKRVFYDAACGVRGKHFDDTNTVWEDFSVHK